MVNENRGVAPLEPTTDVGKLRQIIGDTSYIDLTPPESGFGNYENFGDEQLESFLAMGGGTNLAYGAGYAYLTLAAQFTSEAIKVVTDDLSIDLSARADGMRKLAAEWFSRGDAADTAGSNNYFNIVYPEYERDCEEYPELAQRPSWWC